jgi:hypothetical protein
MNQDSYALEEIGIPVPPGNEIQIELFEKFLAALEARREVTFTQTRRGLKLRSHEPLGDLGEDERRRQINLIHRTLAILRAGLGYLVATKGCAIHFEFWVECPVVGGLPPHRWTWMGYLYNPTNC